MKIEPGKYYANKRGEKIGPMIWKDGISYPWYADNSVSSFTSDGKLFVGGETAGDLIAEWQDEPRAAHVTMSDEAYFEGRAANPPAGPALLDWSATASTDYAPLAAVLQEAYDQAARGKGYDRHDNGEPFTGQRAMSIGRKVGPGFPLGQSLKKTEEAATMIGKGQPDAAIRELLGAINYAASAIMLIRAQNTGA